MSSYNPRDSRYPPVPAGSRGYSTGGAGYHRDQQQHQLAPLPGGGGGGYRNGSFYGGGGLVRAAHPGPGGVYLNPNYLGKPKNNRYYQHQLQMGNVVAGAEIGGGYDGGPMGGAEGYHGGYSMARSIKNSVNT